MGERFIIQGRLDGLNKLIQSNRQGWQAGASCKKKNQRAVLEALLEHLPDYQTESPIRLNIAWYEENKKRDPDNVFFGVKYILDGMVEFGTIQNDNQKYVKGITNELFVDKDNPRIEVEIEEVD